MRIERSVTSISWIPSEAVKGALKVPFELGMAHYDDPLPEIVDEFILRSLQNNDKLRFANLLKAYIEVEDGRIVGHGHLGEGLIGATTMRIGPKQMTFQAIPFETLRPDVEVTEDSVRFVQTAGGRTGAPAPRPVPHPPFVKIEAPSAWTTLALTIHADGRSEFEVVGASAFPRHWIYDHDGKLAAKSGLIDFKDWSKHAFGQRTPWGEEDSPALVTAVETALERELSVKIMRGGKKPKRRKVKKGKTLTEQGQPGDEMFLLLDGVLAVEVDGEQLAELGPGAVVGERAILEGGTRTSTLRAVTACTVAVAGGEDVDRAALEELASGHRREDG